MKKILLVLSLSFHALVFSQAEAVITAPEDSVCMGQSITLSSSASTNGGSPILRSVWNITGPNSFNLVDTTLVGSDLILNNMFSPGLYTVNLINQHQNGTSSFSQEIDFIHVFALPVAYFTLSDVIACYGIPYNTSTTNMSSHPSGSFGEGNNNTSWATNGFDWYLDGVLLQENSSMAAVFTNTISHTTVISLVAEDAMGCVSEPYFDTAEVREPIADLDISSDLCNSPSLNNFNLNSINNENILEYKWRIDGGNQVSSASPSYTVNWYIQSISTLSATHTVELIVVDDLGCADTMFNIITIHAPHASFNSVMQGSSQDQFGNFVCPPVVADFTNTSNSASSISSSWILGIIPQNPNLIITTEDNAQGIQYLHAGVFHPTLIIEDQTGCRDTSIHPGLTIYGPSADISLNQTGNQNFMEYSFNITNLSNVASIEWNLGNGETIENDFDGFSYTYTTNGTFNPNVTLVDIMGCSVNYYLGSITTGINNLDMLTKNEPVFYPNPTSGFITLKQSNFSEILIQDLKGKQISKDSYSITNNQIDLRNLNAGIYFLKLDGTSYKIVKN